MRSSVPPSQSVFARIGGWTTCSQGTMIAAGSNETFVRTISGRGIPHEFNSSRSNEASSTFVYSSIGLQAACATAASSTSTSRTVACVALRCALSRVHRDSLIERILAHLATHETDDINDPSAPPLGACAAPPAHHRPSPDCAHRCGAPHLPPRPTVCLNTLSSSPILPKRITSTAKCLRSHRQRLEARGPSGRICRALQSRCRSVREAESHR